MEQHQILAMLAGYNPVFAYPSENPELHPYRVEIPGLDITVPVTWAQHEIRLDQGYGRESRL